eukprot:TRINITY_DN41407_c0_g1_i1.p1 TRINITY_DN41407_c0_g1~~TRINITY_DN41407_c0_g1_i1.p1  ORF type:complete len:1046 (+),score=209.61 TRINITY_DN41407_c0_g1_i1:316-3138(+)
MLSRQSEAEKDHDRRRAHQILAELSQTQYEHSESSKKWAVYNGRKDALMRLASERLTQLKREQPKTQETQESLFSQLAIETGFAAEDPPEAALDPKRVFEVLVDEVEDCKVKDIASVRTYLGTEYSKLCDSFTQVHHILLERLLEKLDKYVTKTQKGFENPSDPRYTMFTSGTKLMEVLELCKKVQQQFYPYSCMGLKEPSVSDATAKKLLERMREGKTLLRAIKKSQPSRLVQLIGFFEPQTFLYLLCSFLTRLFGGSIGPARGYLFNKVVLSASLTDWQEPVLYYLGCISVIFFLDWYVNDWLSMVSTTKATGLLKHSLRTKLFEAVMRQDTEFFEANDSSAIQDRVKHDCDHVADHIIYIPMDIVGIISSIAWHVLLIYSFCPGMLLRTVAVGLVIAPLFMVLNRLTNKIRRKDDRSVRAIRSQTDEMLSKVRAVREFSREAQEAVELDRSERVQMRSMIFLHIMGHVQHMLIFTALTGGELANYYFGASLVNSGELNPVKLIQIGGMVYHITFSMRHLMEQVPRLMRCFIPAGRVFELLESKSLIEPMPGDRKAEFEKLNGGIELKFCDVTFAYPLMPEITVLRHLSLTIPAGKTVAICGERAAGKSTIFALMQRMYDVEFGNGEVVVNGRPISHWDVRGYRRNIAILAQKGLLFKGTIKENILYGLNEEEKRARGFHTPEGDSELQRLLEMAGAWNIVKEFPLKMEQRIGTGGVSLSGGTEQCLFIARGLVKQPAMLLMDEATSAMDTHTQNMAADGIAAEQQRLGFSIVQVAHRIETLRRSDILYFVEHGKVVEVGGLESMNGKAIEELSAMPIEYEQVVNPETGKEEQRLVRGFYRHLHEAYYDLNFHKMALPALLKKVRSLEEQLARAKAEKEAQLAPLLCKFPPPVLPLARGFTERPSTANKNTACRQPPLDDSCPSPLAILSLSRALSHA